MYSYCQQFQILKSLYLNIHVAQSSAIHFYITIINITKFNCFQMQTCSLIFSFKVFRTVLWQHTFAHRIVTPCLSETLRSLPRPPKLIINCVFYCSRSSVILWSSGTFQSYFWLYYEAIGGSSQTELFSFSTHGLVFPVQHCFSHSLLWPECTAT